MKKIKKNRKPHRFKKRKPFYYNRFFWIIILSLSVFSLFFYLLFLFKFFNVNKIEITGTERVEKEQVVLSVSEKTKNNILFFSSESIFLVNKNKIKEEILKDFPQVAEVKVKRILPDRLNILVVERKELAFFCQENNCFFIDKEGVIFDFKKERNSLIEIKEERERPAIALGEKVIEKEELAGILEINHHLEKSINLPAEKFIISLREKLTVITKKGFKVYFNLHEDVKWQITKLKVLLEEKISEEEKEKLEYIELRFGNFANPKYID